MQRVLEILPHNCAWLVGLPRNRSALHESRFRPGVHSATNKRLIYKHFQRPACRGVVVSESR